MSIVKIGIMTPKQMRQYTIDVASGKIKPSKDSPKIFFPSIRAFAEAVENNESLLAAMIKYKPNSIRELATLVGKDYGNVSRNVKKLNKYGLVDVIKSETTKEKKPVSLFDSYELLYSVAGLDAAY